VTAYAAVSARAYWLMLKIARHGACRIRQADTATAAA
jgi:hypothetical protein